MVDFNFSLDDDWIDEIEFDDDSPKKEKKEEKVWCALFQVEQATYRCFQCSTEWPSVAEMYAELVEKFRAASRRLEDIRELAKNILVY